MRSERQGHLSSLDRQGGAGFGGSADPPRSHAGASLDPTGFKSELAFDFVVRDDEFGRGVPAAENARIHCGLTESSRGRLAPTPGMA